MSNPEELDKVRMQIDQVDDGILDLLKQRTQLVDNVAAIKREQGLETYQPARYQALVDRLTSKALGEGLDPGLVTGVWGAIHDASLTQQNTVLNSEQ